ncbi:hypothetical protein OF83DRAFT_1066560 [Amylostereum chailletii]|nr:hypothetical protein OF83DRAFT_1066560 [Amylostereum chailletii]
MEKEIRDRRKRLSKLARYLGEGVPADLVSVPTRRSRKPRSLSISVSSSSEHLPMPPMPTRRQGWSGEWNAASVQDVIVKLRDLK